MNIVCIVQAHMGSKRLPGKALMPIAIGNDAIPWSMHTLVVQRCLYAQEPTQFVVAIPVGAANKPLEHNSYGKGVHIFKGPDEDVLDRFWLAATEFEADIVVRVCGDCPFMWGKVIDDVIYDLIAHRMDYSCNFWPHRTFPRGLEVEAFHYDVLKWLHRCKDINPRYWRHVTEAIFVQPNRFNLGCVSHTSNCSDARLTVDTAEDLEAARAIYKHMHEYDSWETAYSIWQEHPEIQALNAHVEQKDPDDE